MIVTAVLISMTKIAACRRVSRYRAAVLLAPSIFVVRKPAAFLMVCV